MRYSFGFLCVCALGVLTLAVLPLSVSAQGAEEGATSEPKLREPAPPSKAATEEPALQGSTGFSSPVRFSQWFWHWHDEGLKIALFSYSPAISPPSSSEGYTLGLELEEMELRVKRARIGLIASAGAVVAGTVFLAVGIPNSDSGPDPRWVSPVIWTGIALFVPGTYGVVISGIMLGVRKRKLRRLQEAHYTTPRRVQWDLAQSRLVF